MSQGGQHACYLCFKLFIWSGTAVLITMIVIDNDNKDEDNNENNNVVDYDCDDG